jgi:pyruvate/2-oxoglutarate dehydrogenase complex dihydrolipoamide acyltransferase (E2) component
MVAIDHGGGVQSRYVHAFKQDIKVKVGQKVKVGDVIALEGMSGNATGYHLHFEIRINGTPTDPKTWMAEKGVTIGTGPNNIKAARTTSEKDSGDAGRESDTTDESDESSKDAKGSSRKKRSYRSSEGEVLTPNAKQWKNIQTVLKTVDESPWRPYSSSRRGGTTPIPTSPCP